APNGGRGRPLYCSVPAVRPQSARLSNPGHPLLSVISMPKEAGTKAPAPGTRAVTVPAPEDLELAKDDALLQLRIGRSAHFYAVVASAALALDGILILLFPPLPSLASSDHGTTALVNSYFLLFPLIAGLVLSAVGLAVKWEVYQLWPWEKHFSATVGALAVNILLAVVY